MFIFLLRPKLEITQIDGNPGEGLLSSGPLALESPPQEGPSSLKFITFSEAFKMGFVYLLAALGMCFGPRKGRIKMCNVQCHAQQGWLGSEGRAVQSTPPMDRALSLVLSIPHVERGFTFSLPLPP